MGLSWREARLLDLADPPLVLKITPLFAKQTQSHFLEDSCRLFECSCRLMELLGLLMEGLRARFLMYSTAMDVFYTGLIVR
jgi:hypothetical protein